MESWLTAGLALMVIALALAWRQERQRRREYVRRQRRDVRDDHSGREALMAERDRLLAAGRAATEALLVVDEELRVQYANPAAEVLFGGLSEPITLIAYTRSLDLERLMADAAGVGDNEALERMVRLEERPHKAVALGVARGVALALTDVSEVQRLSRARQNMVANLSHELRTPLTSLRLLADTLVGPAAQDVKVVQDLAVKVGAEVDTLQQMAQEMLDLAAIESGRQVVRLVPECLRQVVLRPLSQMADQAGRQQIQLTNEVPEVLRVLADAEQAARAVGNVLHNALKFTPPGGEVRLTGRYDEAQNRVVLSIFDTGPGIPPDELERIFERFFRSDRARGTPGTGLGLSIARHILRAHGGQVWAENRAPPQSGAVFHLAFQPA